MGFFIICKARLRRLVDEGPDFIMMQEDLKELITPTIAAMGFVLWGCEYLASGRHALLRIYIDRPEGITVDDCQAVSHQISALLDVEDPIPQNYRLEISSPGIPRPLFYPQQYQAYVGHRVQIKTYAPVAGMGRKIVGVIESTSPTSVVLDSDKGHLDIFFSNIAKAYLTV